MENFERLHNHILVARFDTSAKTEKNIFHLFNSRYRRFNKAKFTTKI